MPTLPNRPPHPLGPDTTRLGSAESRRQAVLLAPPSQPGSRYPGDGGRILPAGGGLSLRHAGRPAPWRPEGR